MGSNTSSSQGSKVLFEMGQNGYAVFRLPAVVYHDGVFLAFCEGRMGIADSSESEIVLRRGIQKGPDITWKDLQVVAKVDGVRLANPVPLVDVTHDTIWVMYETPLHEPGSKIGQSLLLVKSTDRGETWSAPRDITAEVFNLMPPNVRHFTPGPAHGIQMASGRLVVPGHVKVNDTNTTSGHASVMLSDDYGETWYPGGYVPSETAADGTSVGTNETTAVALSEDTICLNSRTLGKGQPRAQSFSTDGGRTFQPPRLISNLIEPSNFDAPAGCEGCMLGFKSPKYAAQSTPWVIFANPANSYLRLKMSIRISQNGCQSWSQPWRLHWFASGYSDMTQYQTNDAIDDGSNPTFAILFESGIVRPYASVTFQTFTLQNVLHGVS